MSTGGIILFCLSAAFAIGGAVGTVLSRNPLRAAMSLLIHIVSLAGIFLVLHAHLLAALQLLVYAGAVVVLFVFVIMLIGPSAEVQPDQEGLPKHAVMKSVGVALLAIMSGGLAFSLIRVSAPWVDIPPCPPGQAECGQFGGVEALGTTIYVDGMVPFELVSVLLLVAIIGAIAVARGRTAKEVEAARIRKEIEAQAEAKIREEEKRLSAEVSAHGGHG
jgi:NADH-quinone oxidoreductase subunit J